MVYAMAAGISRKGYNAKSVMNDSEISSFENTERKPFQNKASLLSARKEKLSLHYRLKTHDSQSAFP